MSGLLCPQLAIQACFTNVCLVAVGWPAGAPRRSLAHLGCANSDLLDHVVTACVARALGLPLDAPVHLNLDPPTTSPRGEVPPVVLALLDTTTRAKITTIVFSSWHGYVHLALRRSPTARDSDIAAAESDLALLKAALRPLLPVDRLEGLMAATLPHLH